MTLLRLPEVIKKTGLSRSAIYAGMKANTFPNAVKISIRAIGWHESTINDWIKAR